MAVQGAPAGWMQDWAALGTGKNAHVGVLLVHGFTGSPASMRPWGEFLNSKGYTVRVPLLPGHGTQPEDLNKVKWQEWPGKVESELRELQKTCSKIFVFGLSMGGGLTLYTTQHHQEKITGIVLVNPMIHIPLVTPTVAKIYSTFKKMRSAVGNDIKRKNVTEYAYDANPLVGIYELTKMLKVTRENLGKVSIPTLLFHSTEDHVLPVSNTEIILKGISSKEKERVELANSYHVATLDHDMEIIFEKSLTFVQERS
jgi:carboxylesterase